MIVLGSKTLLCIVGLCMHLSKLNLTNIRGISSLEWAPSREELAGWHVVLGNNGAGKTSLLRAAALGLIGKVRAPALRQSWDEWLTYGVKRGNIVLNVTTDAGWDRVLKRDKTLADPPNHAEVRLTFHSTGSKQPVALRSPDDPSGVSYVIGGGMLGWFAASFGAFRRFPRRPESEIALREIHRHLTLFDEDLALVGTLEWLRNLRHKQHERDPEGDLLDELRRFVNQEGFLPDGVRMADVTSDHVFFEDARGAKVRVEELGDGFRSILSLTFELIRQLSYAFPEEKLFSDGEQFCVEPPGVVLIDEVDAHLHPRWQREIGFWLRKHFPNMQFVVTTHSPLVCQAAEKGSVFLLPRPDSDEEPRMLAGEELERLLYGNILDAYATEPFARSAERSPAGKQRRKRLADLNVKELQKGLNAAEKQEQSRLRAAMPTSATAE